MAKAKDAQKIAADVAEKLEKEAKKVTKKEKKSHFLRNSLIVVVAIVILVPVLRRALSGQAAKS